MKLKKNMGYSDIMNQLLALPNNYLKRKYLIKRKIGDNYPEKSSGPVVLHIYII